MTEIEIAKIAAITELKSDLDHTIRRLTELWGEIETRKYLAHVVGRTWGKKIIYDDTTTS